MGASGSRTALTGTMLAPASSETVGWRSSCIHEAAAPVPCTVLDPFAGCGTTLAVAKSLDRQAIGVELNPKYLRLIRDRVSRSAAQMSIEGMS